MLWDCVSCAGENVYLTFLDPDLLGGKAFNFSYVSGVIIPLYPFLWACSYWLQNLRIGQQASFIHYNQSSDFYLILSSWLVIGWFNWRHKISFRVCLENVHTWMDNFACSGSNTERLFERNHNFTENQLIGFDEEGICKWLAWKLLTIVLIFFHKYAKTRAKSWREW